MFVLNIESTQGSDWGKVCYQKSEEAKKKVFPYHIPSGEIYNTDDSSIIRFKCVLLTIATPIVSVIRAVYWLAKAAFLTLDAAFRFLDGQDGNMERIYKILESAADSVRALVYGALMIGCAVGGIAAPMMFRRYYGALERTLNRQPNGPHKDKWYMAFCFQRLYVLKDPSKIGENSILANKLYRNLSGECDSRKHLKDDEIPENVPAS